MLLPNILIPCPRGQGNEGVTESVVTIGLIPSRMAVQGVLNREKLAAYT
jgi:hypothetical protein